MNYYNYLMQIKRMRFGVDINEQFICVTVLTGIFSPYSYQSIRRYIAFFSMNEFWNFNIYYLSPRKKKNMFDKAIFCGLMSLITMYKI